MAHLKLMLDSDLPEALHSAWTTGAGATDVTRLTIDGLLELVDTAPNRVTPVADRLREHHAGLAPLWHVAQATRTRDPRASLGRLRDELDTAVSRSVEAAAGWLDERQAVARAAPGSSVVEKVLARRAATSVSQSAATVGVCGADALGPYAIVNIAGTDKLARQLPTLVVTTSVKLVPEPVFDTLGSPTFEKIPLSRFAAVVLDGEVISPGEAGRRAGLAAMESSFPSSGIEPQP